MRENRDSSVIYVNTCNFWVRNYSTIPYSACAILSRTDRLQVKLNPSVETFLI